MRFRSTITAALAGVVLAGGASAQTLQNGSFETPSPTDPSLPQGWARFNNALYRSTTDGLLPAALVRTGTHSIELPSGADFNGFTSDTRLNVLDPESPFNNPAVTFPGQDYEVVGWYAIPAATPLEQGALVGLKLEFRRANNSIFESYQYTSIRGHTDGQFVKFRFVVTTEQLESVNRRFPPGPTRVSVLPIRVGPTTEPIGGTGTIFWDDISFGPVQAGGDACRADFNDDAVVNVADIFAFLSAWFAGCP